MEASTDPPLPAVMPIKGDLHEIKRLKLVVRRPVGAMSGPGSRQGFPIMTSGPRCTVSLLV